MAGAFAKAFYNSQEWIKIAWAYREKHFYICERTLKRRVSDATRSIAFMLFGDRANHRVEFIQ